MTQPSCKTRCPNSCAKLNRWRHVLLSSLLTKIGCFDAIESASTSLETLGNVVTKIPSISQSLVMSLIGPKPKLKCFLNCRAAFSISWKFCTGSTEGIEYLGSLKLASINSTNLFKYSPCAMTDCFVNTFAVLLLRKFICSSCKIG